LEEVMPTGIILSSGSAGATQEDIEKVLEKHGLEPDRPEPGTPDAEAVAPKREDFKTDEEFTAAEEKFAEDEAEREAAAEAEEEKKDEERRKKQEERHPHMTRRQRDRERAIRAATREQQEELKKLRSELDALRGEKPAVAAKPPEAPKRADFKTDAEFEEAVFDWRYKVRRAKEEYEAQQNAAQLEQKETLSNYQKSIAKFRDGLEVDDWKETIDQAIPMWSGVQLAIIRLENAPQVAYYLGKHPDVALKLAEMNELAAIMEVGRLADKLAGKRPTAAASSETEREKPKPRPRLPEPVAPLSTAATASALTSKDAAQKHDYKAFKAAQRRGA
jgi:hypothetical protein